MGKVRIKSGAQVGRDMQFFNWNLGRIVFDAKKVGESLWKLTAPGYGEEGEYGNGAVYVYSQEKMEQIEDPIETTGEDSNSCAASPWTYRTDTGDEHGKVVDSAELPKNESKEYLIKFGATVIIGHLFFIPGDENYWTVGDMKVGTNWIKVNVIAWAEINK